MAERIHRYNIKCSLKYSEGVDVITGVIIIDKTMTKTIEDLLKGPGEIKIRINHYLLVTSLGSLSVL